MILTILPASEDREDVEDHEGGGRDHHHPPPLQGGGRRMMDDQSPVLGSRRTVARERGGWVARKTEASPQGDGGVRSLRRGYRSRRGRDSPGRASRTGAPPADSAR